MVSKLEFECFEFMLVFKRKSDQQVGSWLLTTFCLSEEASVVPGNPNKLSEVGTACSSFSLVSPISNFISLLTYYKRHLVRTKSMSKVRRK